jgi:Tfp pilus assembly protein PilO
MDKTRLWIIGSAVAMVAIVALGWLVGVQPQLAAASTADSQTAEVQALNQKNALVLAELQKQYKDLPALKEKLAALGLSVPADVQMPAFIDELTAVAAANGVIFTKWTAADGQAYTPVEAPVEAAHRRRPPHRHRPRRLRSRVYLRW